MIHWDGCKARQIASAPRKKDYVGCKRCKSAYPTNFLSVRDYLCHEITQSMGLFIDMVQKSHLNTFHFFIERGHSLQILANDIFGNNLFIRSGFFFYYIFVLFINSSVCVY